MKTRSKFNEDAGVAVHECLATMKVIRSLLRWEVLSGECLACGDGSYGAQSEQS